MKTQFGNNADAANDSVPDLNPGSPVTDATHKPRGKPFPPGNREGKGRPRGSRNKASVLWLGMIEEYGQPLIRKMLKMALEGNVVALKLSVERLVAPRDLVFLEGH